MSGLFSLTNQVALVTGATGHLGKSMVQGLAEAGATVYINGRDEVKVNQLVNSLKAQDLKVLPAVFDITNSQQVSEFVSTFSHEKLNILINNAYAGGGANTLSSTDEAYLSSFNITLVAAQRLLKNFMLLIDEAIKQDGNGCCINISSMYGMVSPEQAIYGQENQVNPPFYGAAKAALIQWTKYAASDLAHRGLRVNCISPGAFPSEQAQTNQKLMSQLKAKIPLERFGQAQELQGAVVYLSSQAASYVTGHNLVVDGGWTIR